MLLGGLHNLSTGIQNLGDKSVKNLEGVLDDMQDAMTHRMGQGGLSNLNIRKNGNQDEAQFDRFKKALSSQRANKVKTLSGLREVNEAYKEQMVYMERTGKTGTKAYSALSTTVERHNFQLDKSTLRLRSANVLLKGLNGTVSVLSAGFNILGKAVTGAFVLIGAIQLVDTMFDTKMLESIIGYFKSLKNASEELALGVKGAVAAAAGGGADFTQLFKGLSLGKRELEGLPEELVKLDKALKTTATRNRVGSPRGNVAPVASGLNAEQAYLDAANKERLSAVSALARATTASDQEEILRLQKKIILLDVLTDKIGKFGLTSDRFFAQVGKAAGLSAERVAEMFDTNSLHLFSKNAKKGFDVAGVAMSTFATDGSLSFADLTDSQQKLVVASIVANSTIKDASDGFLYGSISAEKLSAKISGITDQLVVFNKQGASQASIHRLETEIKLLQKYEKYLVDLEKTVKGLDTSFSKNVKSFDTAFWSGAVNSQGVYAKTQLEIIANQDTILDTTVNSLAVDTKRLAKLEKWSSTLKKVGAVLPKSLALELTTLQGNQEAYNKVLKIYINRIAEAGTALATLAAKQKKELAQVTELNKQGKLQNAIKLEAARISLDSAIEKIKLETLEKQLEIDNALIANQEAKLSLALQQVQAVDDLMTKIKEGDAKNIDNLLNRQKATVSDAASETSPLTTGSEALNAAIIKGDIFSKKETERKTAVIELEKRMREEIQAKQLAAFDKETANIHAKISADIASNNAQSVMLDLQAKLDNARIIAQINAITAEKAIVQAQISAYITFATGVQGFGKHVANMATVLNQFLAGIPAIFGAKANITVPDVQDNLSGIIANGKAAQSTLTEITDTRIDSLNREAVAINKVRDLKTAQLALELARLQELQTETTTLRAIERDTLITEQKTKIAGLNNEIADLATTAAAGSDKLSPLQEKLKEVFDALKGNIENALTSLNDWFFYGEGNISDIIGETFRSMQKDFFKITVADPLSEYASTAIFGALGVTMKKGADNASIIPVMGKSALAVAMVGGEDLGFKNVTDLLTTNEESKGNWISKFFGKEGTIATGFSNIFGQGGFLTNLLSGFGSFLGSIFSGFLGFASGGSVLHMAQGGGVQKLAGGGSALRDRVPSLLEPGEFVMRKASARKIGAPALQQMNATGNVGGAGGGNIQVNVNNEGAPKDATVSSPKFDGEKYVIDIITRDLANNGPIRRSMRGTK